MTASAHFLSEKSILFYDGDCGFCNRSVQFILTQEHSAQIYFSPLQSDFAVAALRSQGIDPFPLTSLYFQHQGVVLSKSAAAFALLPYLKWYWQVLRIFQFIPRQWSDRLYDFIAKRRASLSTSYCVLPSPQQASRFIH